MLSQSIKSARLFSGIIVMWVAAVCVACGASRGDTSDTLTRLGRSIGESKLLSNENSALQRQVYVTSAVANLADGSVLGLVGHSQERNRQTIERIRMQQGSMGAIRSRMSDQQWKLADMRSRISDQQWKLADMRSRISDQQWKLANMRSQMSDQQWKLADMRSRIAARQEVQHIQAIRMNDSSKLQAYRDVYGLNTKEQVRHKLQDFGTELRKNWRQYRTDLRIRMADAKFDYFKGGAKFPSPPARIPYNWRADPGLVLDTRIRWHSSIAGPREALASMGSARWAMRRAAAGNVILTMDAAHQVTQNYWTFVAKTWNASSPRLPSGQYRYTTVNGTISKFHYTPARR